MISIIVEQEILELQEISLSINLKSPLFFGELIFEGSYIFDFSVPATARNMKIFGFSNKPGIESVSASFEGSIYFNLVKLFDGEIKVVKSSDDFFDLRFFMFNGYLNSKIQNKKINDITLGEKEVVLPAISSIFRVIHVDEYLSQNNPSGHNLNPEFFRMNHNGTYGYFHELNNVYTVTASCYLRFWGAIHLEISYGDCFLEIYKNNVIQQSIYFDKPVKKFLFEGSFNHGDTIVFAIHSHYEYHTLVWKVDYILRGNSFLCCDDWITSKKTILEPGHSDICFFPVLNEKAYETITNEILKSQYETILPVINYYQPVSSSVQRFSPYFCSTNAIIGNVFVPFVFFRFILNRICEQFEFNISFDTNLEDEINTLVLGNNRAINKTELYARLSEIQPYNDVITQYFFIESEIQLADHVPDISITDFIKIINLFGLVIVPTGNKQFVIKSLNDILANSSYNYLTEVSGKPEIERSVYDGYILEYKPANDAITDLIKEIDTAKIKGTVQSVNNLPGGNNTILDLYYVTDVKQYFIWDYDNVSDTLTWQFYSLPYKLDKTQEGDNPINIQFDVFPVIPKDNPKFDITETDTSLAGFWLIPKSSFGLHFPDKYETRDNKKPNWITFYRGMVPTSLSMLYPMGSSQNFNLSGTVINGCAVDLFVDGANGLFEKYWKKWISFLSGSRQVTIYKKIDTQELLLLDFTKKYLFENRLYFIKEVSFTLSHQGYSVAEFILTTV